MSVAVIVRFSTPKEDATRSHDEISVKVNDLARSLGCIHHHAYYSDQTGQGVIVDEWESEDGFQEFFGSDTFRSALQAALPEAAEPDEVLVLEPLAGDPANVW